MPIYEYRCDDCEVSFEAFVRPGHLDDADPLTADAAPRDTLTPNDLVAEWQGAP